VKNNLQHSFHLLLLLLVLVMVVVVVVLLLQGLADHDSKHASDVFSVGRIARSPFLSCQFWPYPSFQRKRKRGKRREEEG